MRDGVADCARIHHRGTVGAVVARLRRAQKPITQIDALQAEPRREPGA